MTLLQYYKKITKKQLTVGFTAILFLFPLLAEGQLSFRYEKSNNCSPSVLTFYNQTVINPAYTYMWDFGIGGNIFSKEPKLEVVYSNAGNFTVTLFQINGTDTIETSQVVSLANGPQAAFTADKTSGCVPFSINFTDNSIPGDASIINYFWDFKTGQVKTGSTASATYSQPGLHDVYLRITDGNGCTSYYDAKKLISANKPPVADFSGDIRFSCQPPLFVHFSNLTQSDGQISSQWNFGNGKVSTGFDVSNLYELPGIYDVSLKVTDPNGCTDSVLKEDYIQTGSTKGSISVKNNGSYLDATDTILCQDKATFYANLSVQPDYTWKIEYNGAKSVLSGKSFIDLVLADSGIIKIKLVYGKTGSCPDSILKTYRVDYIDAGLNLSSNYSCKFPSVVNLSNQSKNALNIKWLLPDGSTATGPTANYTIEDEKSYERTYTHEIKSYYSEFGIVAVSKNGCADTAFKTFTTSPPVARFMPDKESGCVPLMVNFYDSSRSNEPYNAITYLVNGTSIPAVRNEPATYTFTNPGIYHVYSVLTNILGCTDTSYAVQIRAGNKPDSAFTSQPLSVCYGNDIKLTYQGTLTENMSLVYSSPGIFTSGEQKNKETIITLRPDTIGVFPVKLVAESNGCTSDSILSAGLTVNGPVGNFTEEFNCDSPLVYLFKSEMKGYTNLEWHIGDSIITGKDSVLYSFSKAGDYLVSLKASNSGTTCSIEKSKNIKVRQIKAEIEVDAIACRGDFVEFKSGNSSGYADSCFMEGFLWKWGDSLPDRRTYQTSYYHVYTDTGTFYPVLEAVDINGCTHSDTAEIRIVAPFPEMTAVPENGCGPQLDVNFSYVNKNSEIDSWAWIFGDFKDENPSTKEHITHSYSSNVSRNYLAVLQVKDIYGCQNIDTALITLNVPLSNFQASRQGVCLGEEVIFRLEDPTVDSYLIDFGDGTSSASSLRHTYNSAGEYTVSLTVRKNGCESVTTKPSYIRVQSVSADFTISQASSSCYPVTITFTHSSPSSAIVAGSWSFGENAAGSFYTPTVQYTYTQPGVFTPVLEVRSLYNCVAQSAQIINIEGPEAIVSFEPAYVCYGDSVKFTLEQLINVDEFRWYFGDGSSSTEQNPWHQYFAQRVITPAIWLKKGSCEVLLSDKVLEVSRVKADFIQSNNNDDYCLNNQLNAVNQSNFYQQSKWYIDDLLVSVDSNLSAYRLNTPGEHTLQLVVYDLGSCSDSTEQIIIVNPLPFFEISGDTFVCKGNSVNLSIADYNSGWQVLWQPEAIMSNPSSPSTIATPDTTMMIFASVTDENGCSSLRSMPIHVEETLVFDRTPANDTFIYIGQSLPLLVVTNDDNMEYLWKPDRRISCTNCPNPVVNPLETTTYTVTFSNECAEVMQDFRVEVIIDFFVEFPKAFSPNGDGENEIFVYEYENVGEIEFKIFNRWGNLVFSTTIPGEGWDGHVNGKLQNADTYTYFVKAKSTHGYEFEKKGSFLLLR